MVVAFCIVFVVQPALGKVSGDLKRFYAWGLRKTRKRGGGKTHFDHLSFICPLVEALA